MDLRLKINSDVYRACFHHALTTSKEEVMGLLLGETNFNETIDKTDLEILGIRIDRRLDKRPDRVEISPEQMVKAAEAAEDLGKRLNRPNIRVIGWYHSHPNITIWPSHVDLRTQYNFQMMDRHFLGLIFSVYSVDKKKVHSYEMVAFQARQVPTSGLEQVLVPFEIVANPGMSRHVGEEMVRVSDILVEENVETVKEVEIKPLENPLAIVRLQTALHAGNTNVMENVTLPTLAQLRMELKLERSNFDFTRQKQKRNQ